MAQHDMNLANADGATFRADANNALAALVSQNSGATEPATTFAYQLWADTTLGLLKIRNAANSAWVTVGTLADANLGLQPYDANTVKKNAENAFTVEQTFTDLAEDMTISASAASGTINFDTKTQNVLYYTTDASGNWTLNVRGDGSISLNTVMATGECKTIVFLATNGATPYYPSALTIDGGAVTPKWSGGTAPSAGNASSIDSYTYSIIKTGSAAFTVLASQTRYA
jgi:hypothetical protein